MRVVTIIQARVGSTRLPGKVLLQVGGKPVLSWVVHRALLAEQSGQIVIATSDLHQDDEIADFCKATGVECFRGSELDVLDRYHGAARAYDAEVIVRITSDCPLLDPVILDEVVLAQLAGKADYVSGDRVPRGLAQEAFSMELLEQAWRDSTDPAEREHVVFYYVARTPQFTILNLPPPPGLDLPHWRLTLDTTEDFELLDGLFEATEGRLFDLTSEEIVAVTAGNSRLLALATREA